ncbi:hypothetical protein [Ammoniphilus sp. CFH 90114]|uniref:hypothetical protein n=1 Tax=Ammoniphilus sp. CFH 90114 TaxID=2493665 RepID=UPI00100DD3F8|nr:hypothetical protein [Ammoniphilus sp. CFH 90114]RXT03875.1 hypothetical protein EIZ39_22175 [Ammoniphilus sp. CFH 90114]
MGKKNIICFLFLMFFISACTNDQRSEMTKIQGDQSFVVTPEEFKDPLEFTIQTKDFSLEQEREIEINRSIKKVEDTDVLLDKLYVREKDVLVSIKLETNIDSIKGRFLSPYEFKTEDQVTRVISTDVDIKVYDENGQRLMEGSGIKENEIGIYLHKDEFENSKEVEFSITGLHVMEYIKK